MTLQLNFPAQVTALQFGVNEISSAITIARWAGSFLSVERDTQIFVALEQQYGVSCEALPEHLRNVHLNRGGTVLGTGQRPIQHDNMLPNISIDSVAGVASFLILILRYVEFPDDIVDYVQSLLKGEFGLVHGGKLQRSDHKQYKEALPHSFRENLAIYIRGILDADADSAQHRKCLQWLSQLSALIGKSRNTSLSKYSRLDHRRLAKHLLDSTPSRPAEFHTLSAGTAMIALAARANGANVELQCATADNDLVVIPQNHPPTTGERPIMVKLWLIEPPEDIAQTIRVVGGGRTSQTQTRSRSHAATSNMLPVYGGNSEISQMIARHMPRAPDAEVCLRLWDEGLRHGAGASWEVSCTALTPSTENMRLRLSESFVRTQTSALLAPLAKIWYAGPSGDKRHDLARKAANVFHAVHQYNDYHGVEVEEARQAMNLVIIAFTVGCLGSLVSNAPDILSAYAFVLEEPYGPDSAGKGLLDFCVGLLDGRPVFDIMYTAGSVWGGLHYRLGFPSGNLMGIVCPEVTILLDVLTDPVRIAEHGLGKGLFSLHKGSVPVLPRDHSGAILAGDPDADGTHKTFKATTKRKTRPEVSDVVSNVIFTLEPFIQSSGSLSAILCGWESGDVAFELNPFDIFINLISKRTLGHEIAESEDRRITTKTMSKEPLVWLGKGELASLQRFAVEGVAVIEAGANFDWQVVAAGCLLPPTATMVVSEDECNLVRKRLSEQTLGTELAHILYKQFSQGRCLILCCKAGEEAASGGQVEEIGSDSDTFQD